MKRAATLAAALVGLATLLASPASATAPGDSLPGRGDDGRHGPRLSLDPVASANPRDGVQNNVLTTSARMRAVAYGNLPLTNPDTANGVTHYGYNTSNIPAGGALTQGPNEAYKTEPDKNVYLVMNGHHYLYQGHEIGPRGYVTRIDLDQADPAKRVSLVTDVDAAGKPFPTIDGITWDPFTKQLLITAEGAGMKGGVWAIGLDANGNATSAAVPLPALGQGGYEGIQNDSDGNVWIVEDTGGVASDGGKAPYSYLYRFVPTDKADLTKGGTLQALQILRADGSPATAAQLSANPRDGFIADLHRYGTSFKTRWVTVHDTAKDGTTPYDAPKAAAAANATPMKRPENGVFRPGSTFTEFYFTETGDTSAASTLPGAYGGVFKLAQRSPGANEGMLSLAIPGDKEHTGFDNLTWLTDTTLLVVEDAGDGLHQQRNALDSGYAYTFTRNGKAPQPVRWLAEGRDASATYDAASGPKYNDGDNEITGIHVSDGDPGVGGLLGAKVPQSTTKGWRTFWTQQHGDNITWEVTWTSVKPGRSDDDE